MGMTQYQKKKDVHRRPRRHRKTDATRGLMREHRVSLDNLIMPLFLIEDVSKEEVIPSLPMAKRQGRDKILREIESCLALGLKHFIMFPKIADGKKDKTGSFGSSSNNYYLQVAEKIKSTFPQITLISDVALDPYSSDGHDGIVKDGKIINDETVDVLVDMAIAQAQAGFDILGPSDMMDGRVGAMRDALDEKGFIDTAILAYTAKYASAFYGPFRDALDSAPVNDPSVPKDKKTYQMDPANKREAMIEAELDYLEGADYLMVKPALHYLDVIHKLHEEFEIPIAAYHVSGECSMLYAACKNGWLDYEIAMPEVLLSIRRAGATAIITYFAKDFALRYPNK